MRKLWARCNACSMKTVVLLEWAMCGECSPMGCMWSVKIVDLGLCVEFENWTMYEAGIVWSVKMWRVVEWLMCRIRIVIVTLSGMQERDRTGQFSDFWFEVPWLMCGSLKMVDSF
ncbi:hypothetical protein AVEN_210185-1 [Araneus ventricosus]|uniref:Protein kinase domain-containing protein n=1 Tax=Araneus ventricosus TaxID=182803 RepID=A0A4Y2LSC0_ARAVE|nr:hypothetical protein AVEN_210185-1 [Araneus ventricosus]